MEEIQNNEEVNVMDVKVEVIKENEIEEVNATPEEVNFEVVKGDTVEIKLEEPEVAPGDKTIVLKSIAEVETPAAGDMKMECINAPVKESDLVKDDDESSESNNKSNKRKINLKEELFKLDSNITYEYNKTIGKLDYSEIKGYQIEDGNKTIVFLFYGNDFYAVNKINFKDGYMYSRKEDYLPVAENLNKIIRKIPNVAKSRNILHTDNIEARIYDMIEYILLLERENIRIIKVAGDGQLAEMKYTEYNPDRKRLEFAVAKMEIAEEEREKEEKSIKNKIIEIGNRIRRTVVMPIKTMLAKLGMSNEIKLLTDGKHSIFEKKL